MAVSLDKVFHVKIDDNPYPATWLENVASRSSAMLKYVGSPMHGPAMSDKVTVSQWLSNSSNHQNISSNQWFQHHYSYKTFMEENLKNNIHNNCSEIQQSFNTLEVVAHRLIHQTKWVWTHKLIIASSITKLEYVITLKMT